MTDDRKPQRLRWFQLGVRDLLWLMAVCGVLIAWWQDRNHLRVALHTSERNAADERAEVEQLQSNFGAVRRELLRTLAGPMHTVPTQASSVQGLVVATT
jgi:hypothetical protein